ncbi:GntR family transcriptional regulator [Mangrovicoccus algicola]
MGRRSLHQEITGEIREMILSGALRPGTKVPEQALAQQLEVSRTPLREALKALSVEGLVTLMPNRGASVSEVSAAQLDDLLPVMGVLEELGAELLCRALDAAPAEERAAMLAQLEQLHAEILAGHAGRDAARFRKANKAFHEALIEMGGNGALLELYRIALARMHMSRFLAEKSEADWNAAMQDHEAIMAALRAGDGALAGRLLRDHVEQTVRRAVLGAIARPG